MDVSSELVHSLLPIFLTGVLGVSLIGVGLIEGFAEGTASILKVFSGAWSDRLRRRKPMVLLGYALSTLTKPLFPIAAGVTEIVTARFLDRIGKGMREAPRDALIADVTHPEQRSAAYGLRQSLDSIGAFLGPLLAIALLMLWPNNIRAVLWVAVIPAALCVLCIFVYVKEPAARQSNSQTRSPLSWENLKRFPADYWWIVALGSTLTLARFSDAFLILRAQSVGLALAWIPSVMILMNVVYAVVAAPAGATADKIGRKPMMLAGILALVAADTILAFAATPAWVFLGTAFWGLHMGLTQGMVFAIVADHAPPELRGTAFGVFNLIIGVFVFISSTLAGALWHWYGPATTFFAGIAFAGIAALGFLAKNNR